jgi:hypothetical protein
MNGVISTTMTEIDSPDEGNVPIKTGRVTNQDHLLMVRSSSAHTLIEQYLTARFGYLSCETSILLRIESEAVAV